ncbi:MAG: class I SAM-dependent methyltransferase [Hyphomicrobiales bacterium]|nr:class I SAM-dependent methyltransferase [Hyphomicrobiales bacterium]
MYLDVTELRDFYATPPGRAVRRKVCRAIAGLAAAQAGECVLGFGFATPYLRSLAGDAERTLAFMPAGQGVIDWPPDGPSRTALVEEDALPLSDASVDLAILSHAIEYSPQPADLIAEMRRVLASGGRLVVVAPNRRGLWARSETSPFGHGRPYSRGQLRALFAEAGFEAEAWTTALHVPPGIMRSMPGTARVLEKIGKTGWPAFSGVICVAARKRTIEGVKVRARPLLTPALRPALQTGNGAMGHSVRQVQNSTQD